MGIRVLVNILIVGKSGFRNSPNVSTSSAAVRVSVLGKARVMSISVFVSDIPVSVEPN